MGHLEKSHLLLGMTVLVHNSASKMLRQEDPELKVSIDYIASGRPVCLKNRDPARAHPDGKGDSLSGRADGVQ